MTATSKGSYTEPVLLLVWAHAALLAARNIPIFVIVAAPLAAEVLHNWLGRLPEFNVAEWLRAAARKFNALAAEVSETDALGRWHIASMAGALVVAALLFAPHPPPRFRAEFDPKAYPAGAIDTLRQSASAHIFTYDQWATT